MKITKALSIKLLKKYCEEMVFSKKYSMGQVSGLIKYWDYLDGLGIDDLRAVNEAIIKDYSITIENYISRKTGKKLCKNKKLNRYSIVKKIHNILVEKNLVLTNPCSDLNVKFSGLSGLRIPLNESEIELFLESFDPEKQLLKRVLFETIYGLALRIGEVVKLNWCDIDFEDSKVIIKQSKWNKDRVVVLTKSLKRWLKLWKDTQNGNEKVFGMSANTIERSFNIAMKALELKKEGVTVHSLRHSLAVHLISRGAELRFVQELLGHESIEATVRYTKDLVENVRRVYKRYHPREGSLEREVDEHYEERVQKLLEDIVAGKARSAEIERLRVSREVKKRASVL